MAAPRSLSARLYRATRIRLAVIAYVVRRLLPPLLLVGLFAAGAAALVRWDVRRAGGEALDFEATLYALYTQLFFEPTEPFPGTRISRVIFWVTPVVGIILIAEGLLKVGASIFDLTTRREVWVSIVSGQLRGHIVVCGLGHVGYRVVEELRRLGEDIVAVEQLEVGAYVDMVRAMDIPVHVGDARRDDLLAAVGMPRAKAVVCATGDDLANLEIALDAKRLNPSVRVVMRMFDQRLAGKVGGALELEESFSTSSLAAPLIAIQATHPGIHAAYRLDDVVHVTAEIVVGATTEPVTIAALEEKMPCRIVSRRCDGKAWCPVRAADKVMPGDVLIVDTAAVDLPAVRFRLGS